MYARPLGPGAHLAPLEPWQAAEFLANLDRCRTHIAPWVGRSFVATDLESAEAVLRRYWDAQALTGGGVHGIRLDGVLVGGVMFVSIDTVTGVAEVGCWLEPAAQGRGLVTRAVGMLLDRAFGERGLRRVIWDTRSDNVPSISTARRLGLTFQEADDSGEHPREIWSITADDWLGRRSSQSSDEDQIDALGAAFFDAFTNADGRKVDLAGALESSFVPGAVIVTHADPVRTESLANFLMPRQKLLMDGELTNFREWETSRTTLVSGDVAQRLVRFAKSGVLRGVPFTGGGAACTQLVRTPAGWRIAAITVRDDSSA
ncbi:ribosomal-protein-serine acetyltransferase [Kitasatospora sp. MAA4]|uniref:GNAT family N-acetyltransferase n=1 Tax=Kitasatospora sp. MAA4 TaxID=3035093 RepID=UPI002475129D|nr:GNAT family protein [Kitasatospora sp. MAA4]MDH6131358.1 ribosomal-protein-serine acetyltransferase [Kitasatospora sp. MAA4]